MKKPTACTITFEPFTLSITYRCGKCDSLNVDHYAQTTKLKEITCPDCKAVNLKPKVALCDCVACTNIKDALLNRYKAKSKV